MKVTLERATLLKALSHVQSVVERRNTIPILSNVLLEAKGDGLTLMATDLDVQIVETIGAIVETEGTTTVSAHTLFDIARKLPEGAQIMLASADGKMTLNASRSRFNLSTLPREDFPMIAEGDLPHTFDMSVDILRQLIDMTRFAVSNEETRYYLNGIYFHKSKEGPPEIRAAATDGHRLARATFPCPEGAVDMPDVIIPRKCVNELRKLLEEAEGHVSISLSTTKIRFNFGAAMLTSKLIDGTFPDYTRVIPKANDKLLVIDPKALKLGVDRVSTIASDKTRAVKVVMARDKVTLMVTSPEIGTAAEEIAGDYTAEGMEIGFNARYLMEILNEIDSDLVEIHLSDSSAPTLIRKNDKSPALYVLMPMRV
jgi:DNA polymerase III subunit beta